MDLPSPMSPLHSATERHGETGRRSSSLPSSEVEKDVDRERRIATDVRYRFLLVYAAATFGDWLQGGYFYKVYDAYGFTRDEIQAFFVVGFGSAAIVGTIVGSLADRFGRTSLVRTYFVVYVAGCLAIHHKSSWCIILGRVLCGVATSLLFSSFDAWLVSSLDDLPSRWTADAYRYAGIVNGASAIVAGVVAEVLVSNVPGKTAMQLSYGASLAPFEMAIVVFIVGLVCTSTWTEPLQKTVDDAQHRTCGSELMSAIRTIYRGDRRILCLGLLTSLFEASMYCFVMQWTPALTENNDDLPLGFIFSLLMAGCMLGSQLFGWFIQSRHVSASIILRFNLIVAFASLCIPIVVKNTGVRFACFLVYEVCVGLYWPCVGYCKSRIVPEACRAAVYSIFRVPLNALVVSILLSNLSIEATFLACSIMLSLAFVCASWIATRDDKEAASLDRTINRAVPLLQDSC